MNAHGPTESIWMRDLEPAQAAAPRKVDVCVVGAGIAGLTTAYLLAKEGKHVVVLDEGEIGGGQTGRTSAHLSCALDGRIEEIERIHGAEGAKLAAGAHAAAIDSIESIVASEGVECEFERVPAYLVAAAVVPRAEAYEMLQRELDAARRAGIAADLVDVIRVGDADGGPCIRFAGQARFHPMKYLAGLARAAQRAGVTIEVGQRVTDVSGGDASHPARVVVAHGRVAWHADAVLVATHMPGAVDSWAELRLDQAPYLTYVVAIEAPAGAIEDALYSDTARPYHYWRLHASPEGGKSVLLVGGEHHEKDQLPDGADPFASLEAWARLTFGGLGPVVSRWSGQVLEPTDGLAFIGRAPIEGTGVYLISGDSGMGLTHGTLGARIVTDLVMGRANPWQALYDPARKSRETLTPP